MEKFFMPNFIKRFRDAQKIAVVPNKTSIGAFTSKDFCFSCFIL